MLLALQLLEKGLSPENVKMLQSYIWNHLVEVTIPKHLNELELEGTQAMASEQQCIFAVLADCLLTKIPSLTAKEVCM